MDCCVEHEKEQKLGRLLDEMATERTNKVITMLFFSGVRCLLTIQ